MSEQIAAQVFAAAIGAIPLPPRIDPIFGQKTVHDLLTAPSDPRALQRLLYTAGQRQYAATLVEELDRFGLVATGYVTDPSVLRYLRQRAAQSAPEIHQTYINALIKHGADDARAMRSSYKPEQIWNRELGQIRQTALIDFYGRNELAATVTAHVEPTEAKRPDQCEAAIGAGSVLLSDLESYPAMPNHPECPHGWVIDEIPAMTVAAFRQSPDPYTAGLDLVPDESTG